MRMLNRAWYLSAVVPSHCETTPTSWLSRARCSSLTWGSLISCDPSQASSLAAALLHYDTDSNQTASQTTLASFKISHLPSLSESTVVDYVWVWDREQQGRSALKLAAVTYTEATGQSTVTLYVNPKCFWCFLWVIFVELSWFWIPSKSVHEIQEMDVLRCFSSWLCSRCWKTLCSPVLYI